MAKRQILAGLHFHQAADSAFKFEPAVACCIKLFGCCIGDCDQLDLMLVERVDQGHKAGGFVAILGPQLGNARNDDCVIMPGNRQIIGGTPRFAA